MHSSSSRPAGGREHACHLMVRFHSSDTAGLCDGWGKGEGGLERLCCLWVTSGCMHQAMCKCVCLVMHLCLSHHAVMHVSGVTEKHNFLLWVTQLGCFKISMNCTMLCGVVVLNILIHTTWVFGDPEACNHCVICI